MAEAEVEQPRPRFYCHQCSVEIDPKLPQYTCPRCDNGFIEQITEEFEEQNNAAAGRSERGPSDQDFAEMWGRQFLQSFRMHSGANHRGNDENRDEDDDDEYETEEEEEDGVASAVRVRPGILPGGIRFHVGGPRRFGAMGPDNTRDPLHTIIEQLLQGLTGGYMPGGVGPGPAGGGFAFGNLMGLHGNPDDYAWGPGGLDTIITQLMNQLEGSGPPPASKEQLDTLPTTEITAEQVENSIQCSVCMEDLKLEEVVKQLPCKHCFHTDCIIPWLKLHGTCPVCRKTLDGHDTTCDQSSTEPTSLPPPNAATSSQPTSSSSNPPGEPPSQSQRNQSNFEEEFD